VPTISSLQEREIREGIQAGGTLRGVFFVARRESYGFEFMVYIRPSWNRRYLPLRTFGDRSDKTYRSFARLLELVRDDFGFSGPILLHDAKAPELSRFKGLRPCDSPADGASPNDEFVDESVEEAEE
jgi:hypothetical protein